MILKKLFLCFLFTLLISFKCSAKEVTEEMLISGKWKCHETLSKYAEYDKNGQKQAYQFRKNLEQFTATYLKKDDQLIVYYNDDYRLKSELAGLTGSHQSTKLYSLNPNINEETDELHDYVFISNDNFKKISTIIIQSADTKKIYIKNYYEVDCVRIFT